MGLKLTVDSVDGLDSAVRGLYVERDGKFHLDVDDLPDTGGVNAALNKERRLAKELKAKIAAWEALGAPPEDLQVLLEAKEDIEREKANVGKTKDEAIAALQRQFDAKMKPITDKLGKLEQERDSAIREHESYRIKTALRNAAVSAKVRSEFLDDVERRAGEFRLIDGQVVAVDEHGEPTQAGPKEWLEEVGKAKPLWFEPSSGGGAAGGSRGTATRPGVVSRDDQQAILRNLVEIADGKVQVQ